MRRPFDLVVFDWDGTLVDSTGVIARAIQSAAADLGLPVPSHQEATHVIGLGLRDALERAVPSLSPDRYAGFADRYRHHYMAAEAGLRLFEGAQDLIAGLRQAGVPLAIATGKNSPGLARALRITGLESVFAATRCADQTHPKPHPAMLLELTAQLGVPVERTLMIGDTTHDLKMAAAAATAAVGVTYGAHPREQLASWNPLALVDSVEQLHRWLTTD